MRTVVAATIEMADRLLASAICLLARFTGSRLPSRGQPKEELERIAAESADVLKNSLLDKMGRAREVKIIAPSGE